MVDCIFCKIARGEIPSYKVYENEQFLAFLDIFPLTPGHTLVIPKQHFRWVWDVQPQTEYWQVINTVAQKLRLKLNTELLASITLGEEVPHAHYHLIPPGEGLITVINTLSRQKKQKLTSTQAEEMLTQLEG